MYEYGQKSVPAWRNPKHEERRGGGGHETRRPPRDEARENYLDVRGLSRLATVIVIVAVDFTRNESTTSTEMVQVPDLVGVPKNLAVSGRT